MAQLTRHSGHLPILSNNHVLWSSHHWFYPYPSTVYSIPAECFSSHVSRLLGRTEGQCIVIFVQIYRGLIKYSIYRGSPISSQIARHFFMLELTKLERGHKRPFETLDYPIGNPSSQCRNPWFRTSSILHPVSGDVQLYFAPSRLQKVSSLRLHLSNGFLSSPAVCNALTWKRCGIISHQLAYVAPLQPMWYSSALCWGVLSAVSSCRTPFLKNVYKLIPLRCTPSTGTKSHNGLLLELSSVACSFHTWDTKIRFSTYCLWSNHQPVFSWTTFAGFVFQGGHIFVHSFIGLFIISLTVQMVQPRPLVVTFLFESNIYFTPISMSIATFRPLLPFTRPTGFTTDT